MQTIRCKSNWTNNVLLKSEAKIRTKDKTTRLTLCLALSPDNRLGNTLMHPLGLTSLSPLSASAIHASLHAWTLFIQHFHTSACCFNFFQQTRKIYWSWEIIFRTQAISRAERSNTCRLISIEVLPSRWEYMSANNSSYNKSISYARE